MKSIYKIGLCSFSAIVTMASTSHAVILKSMPAKAQKSLTSIIFTVTPNSGPTAGGTELTLNVSDIGPADRSVMIDGKPCKIISAPKTEPVQTSVRGDVVCITPPHVPGTVDIKFTTPTGSSVYANGFSYVSPVTKKPVGQIKR